MSDLNRIIEMIKNPEKTGDVTLQDILMMLDKWPWCSTIHMLLLQRMHSTDDPAFLSQLNRSAISIPDRTVLFRMIHNNRISSSVAGKSKTGQTIPEVHAEEADQNMGGKPERTTGQESVTISGGISADREALINEFIHNEPRISPRDGDFAEAVLIAERSNTPSFDFVTETLANIYLQQGNKKQAIKIFKQLSLTIPEKSSYFAARIEEITKPGNRL